LILQRLVEFAEREGLDPLWRDAPVDFAVDLDADGKFLGLTALGDGKRGMMMRVPVEPNRPGNIRPVLLVDNVRYVLGVPKPEADGSVSKKGVEQAGAYFEAFAEKMINESATRKIPELAAVASYLVTRRSQRLRPNDEMLGVRQWTGSERICFRIAGNFLQENNQCKSAYAELMAVGEEGATGICSVNGSTSKIARLHPMLKHVPTANTAGASLVSFNSNSFESHGLVQGANAPVSIDAAQKYTAALNHLLERTEQRTFRQGVKVGDDSVTLFWTRTKTSFEDALAAMFAPAHEDKKIAQTEDVLRVAESPWRGIEPSAYDAVAFYALFIAGNAARVVIRDWFESTAGAVKVNVRQYFSDLALGEAPAEPIPLYLLMKCLESPQAGASSSLITKTFRAALIGGPFPRELLSLALRRLRLPPGQMEGHSTLRNRVAIVKAVLLRLPPPQRKELTVSLDENNADIPYLLGRLFASLERLQGDALGDVNATIRDKFFASSSATPATAFPRLLRLSMHHASKAEGKGFRAEKVKGSVLGKLPATCHFQRLWALSTKASLPWATTTSAKLFFERIQAMKPAPNLLQK
jgi:CRISPR-associated protein Csd1